jgi:hypothetical protein
MSYIISNPSDLARTKNKWGMGYYDTDIFPFPQGTAGPFQAFPGTPGLANPPFGNPIPPVMTCPKPATGMGMFRPNQAVARGLYSLGQASTPLISTSGLTVDPTLLFGGVALLAAAMFLFGAKKAPAIRQRKIRRYRRKLAALEAA